MFRFVHGVPLQAVVRLKLGRLSRKHSRKRLRLVQLSLEAMLIDFLLPALQPLRQAAGLGHVMCLFSVMSQAYAGTYVYQDRICTDMRFLFRCKIVVCRGVCQGGFLQRNVRFVVSDDRFYTEALLGGRVRLNK